VVLLILTTLSVWLVTRGTGSPSSVTTSSVGTSTPSTTSTTTTSPYPATVGRTTVLVTEPASGSVAARSLLTVVRFPASGTTPLLAHAPYPLVVFSQGYGVAPEAYVHLLNAWAAAGYVVADPAYPFTSVSSPGGLVRTDIVNHPRDLSQVITSLLHDSSTAGQVLSGLIDPSRIAVIGHSDGGDVALAAVANDCCRDPRITAAILLSGAELAWFPGKYFTTPGVPMLVVQGSIDYDLNPVPCSVALYNAAPRPKYYLSMIGQTHFSAYLPPGRALNVVTRTTIDFLNGYLRHTSAALASMISAGTVPGLAAITSQVPVPAVAGTCPDGPVG
jgi:predicted dienelactone hydrolase